MKFDNQKTTYRVFLRKMLIAIIAAICVVAILATPWFIPELLGISQYQWILIVAGIYVLMMVISWIRDLNYFYFDDKGETIIIRYYPIRPLGRRKRAVQIQKISFAGYEIKMTRLGLRKTLILKQHVKKKVASYPAIGITALTRHELQILEMQLSAYVH